MNSNLTEIEKRLWGAADELRANSKLKSSEYAATRPESHTVYDEVGCMGRGCRHRFPQCLHRIMMNTWPLRWATYDIH